MALNNPFTFQQYSIIISIDFYSHLRISYKHDICHYISMQLKIIIPSLLLSLGIASGCKEVKDPEFRKVDEFGLRNLSLVDATVGFSVTYFNPNDF